MQPLIVVLQLNSVSRLQSPIALPIPHCPDQAHAPGYLTKAGIDPAAIGRVSHQEGQFYYLGARGDPMGRQEEDVVELPGRPSPPTEEAASLSRAEWLRIHRALHAPQKPSGLKVEGRWVRITVTRNGYHPTSAPAHLLRPEVRKLETSQLHFCPQGTTSVPSFILHVLALSAICHTCTSPMCRWHTHPKMCGSGLSS